MVILLKNRAAIYQREAAEMLHNISLYPGLTEEQLCRFFPEKEATAKTLLAHMLKEGRIFCSGNDRYYANREVQGNAVKDLSRCVWVLLDFIDQVEYHTVGEFPAAILCFANGELYEIVPIPQGNLPIKAVRDYDNLELKAVIDVIATFCLTDDTGALCDSFQTTRFGYSSSTVITVMPKNCFSAWLSTPKLAENRPPLFPKNS